MPCTGVEIVPPAFLALLNGDFEEDVDAHAIQPIYTLKLAETAALQISAILEGEDVVFEAKSA